MNTELGVDDVVVFGMVLVLLILRKSNSSPPRRRRRFKRRPINRDREQKGFYKASFLPMKGRDPEMFFKYTRMSVACFDKLLAKITPLISSRRASDAIGSEQKLAITLHFFSQGSSMWTIAWKYKIGHSAVHYIIKETAEAIWTVLNAKFLKAPANEGDWTRIADEFYGQWNFPNCLGALDGKHIEIQAPANTGSQFFNYKKQFSVVLMACCDANYLFTLVDIGAYGSESDGGVFSQSAFGTKFENNEMHIPAPRQLPNSQTIAPFTLIADEAFPLKDYIMRPYPGRTLDNERRIFNYRLSRARRVIENAFGILVNWWRLLRKRIDANVNNVDLFIKAIICLHNFVKMEEPAIYCPPGFVDSDDKKGIWRKGVKPLKSVGRIGANRGAARQYNARDNLKNYFISPSGELEWQYKVLSDGGL